MPTTPVDLKALSEAISTGVVAGTARVVESFATAADKRHDLRNNLETNNLKMSELDREVSLLKGMMTSLVGRGDGSTGMVPRMEGDMEGLRSDVAEVKSDVQGLKRDVTSILASLDDMKKAQSKSTTFMDGWKGIGIFLGFVCTCLTIMGGVFAGLWWLYTHGAASWAAH